MSPRGRLLPGGGKWGEASYKGKWPQNFLGKNWLCTLASKVDFLEWGGAIKEGVVPIWNRFPPSESNKEPDPNRSKGGGQLGGRLWYAFKINKSLSRPFATIWQALWGIFFHGIYQEASWCALVTFTQFGFSSSSKPAYISHLLQFPPKDDNACVISPSIIANIPPQRVFITSIRAFFWSFCIQCEGIATMPSIISCGCFCARVIRIRGGGVVKTPRWI